MWADDVFWYPLFLGGKVEPTDASVRAAAARELLEEAGIAADAADAATFRRRGTLTFHFDDQPRPWRVAVYEATAWTGEPAESDEMAPRWFDEKDIPYGVAPLASIRAPYCASASA